MSDEVKTWLPQNHEDWKYYGTADADYSGYSGYFNTKEEIDTFLKGIKQNLKKS